jgi:hypothetical protein
MGWPDLPFVPRPWVALVWIAAWVLASLVYRKINGKPIFYPKLSGIRYRQGDASGHSHRAWYTRLGGANRCLVVQVTESELDIHPYPPFNWGFLPEFYGLEYRVPLSDVRSAELRKRLFRNSVELVLRTPERGDEKVTLYLARPEDFLTAVGSQIAGASLA